MKMPGDIFMVRRALQGMGVIEKVQDPVQERNGCRLKA
jgi:hypothetical protein